MARQRLEVAVVVVQVTQILPQQRVLAVLVAVVVLVLVIQGTPLLAPQIQAAVVVVVVELALTDMGQMAAPASLLFGMPILMMTLYPPQDPQPSQTPAAIKSTNGPAPVRSHSKRQQWHTLHS